MLCSNEYKMSFYVRCPSDKELIKYSLSLTTDVTIMVESLIEFVKQIEEDYQENIADRLFKKFGGISVLSATHQGVTIITTRL